MKLLAFLMAATITVSGFAAPAAAQTGWNSAHISITKFKTWSVYLDGIDQPHIDVTIYNDGTEPVGTVDFHCKLSLLDRTTPVFEDEWSTDLDQVIRPGQSQTLNLKPNMFSDLGHVIQHRYENANWSCFVIRVLTASGHTLTFEPGQSLTAAPPFGVAYVPVPDGMATLLKVPEGSGMLVIKMLPQSPAASVGIKPGDVVLAVDGKPMKAVADLPSALKDARVAGRAAHLSVTRAGEPIEVLVPADGPTSAGPLASDPPKTSSVTEGHQP